MKKKKLSDRDVRIIYLPPMTVAAIHSIGTEPAPELHTDELLQALIKETNLQEVYPAARHLGFNNPDQPVHGPQHGYERWISIPDGMDVPPPFTKKRFPGGVYAAHTIPMGAWEEWGWLHSWVENSRRYDFRWGTIDSISGSKICGWLEEHLNYWNWYTPGLTMEENDKHKQLDLLIPVQERR